MKKYKVIVTARSFGTADQKAEELLLQNNCEIVRIKAGDKSVEEQVAEEIKTADAVIAGLCSNSWIGRIWERFDSVCPSFEGNITLWCWI